MGASVFFRGKHPEINLCYPDMGQRLIPK